MTDKSFSYSHITNSFSLDMSSGAYHS